MTTNDKRHVPRFECKGHVDAVLYIGSPACAAIILDLSLEGCLIKLGRPHRLCLGDRVELTFQVNHLHFRVWADAKSFRPLRIIGFQFPKLSERSKRQLEDLVEELAEKSEEAHVSK